MNKYFSKSLVFASLSLAGTSAALAQELPTEPGGWEYLGPGLVRGCDASACYTYWDTGDNNWVLINVETRPPPGGRHEN